MTAATGSITMPGIEIDAITLDYGREPAIRFGGPLTGEAPALVALRGARQDLPAVVTSADGIWEAVVPLRESRWHGPALAPRSGRYDIIAENRNGNPILITVTAELPAPQLVPGVTRVVFDGGLIVQFTPPLSDRERGPLQQAALEADYRAARYEPINGVFFESFYGRNASCNPLAIDRALARMRPDVARYWSVVDGSVEVPEGAVALIEGSAEWWRIRGSVRLFVVNDWLRKRFAKRRYQKVLQTWHGTMLKKLALSRSKQGVRAAIATVLESRRWDVMLAQNEHSRRVFRRAYAFLGKIWEVGYPRDDVLTAGNAASVRARLDIADDLTVVLYAPTWRDDHPDHVDHLDVARFAAGLGPGYLTLIRGHSRTLLPGENVTAPGVMDVTGYPDVSELFLIADALVTDYSSVMFDYSVTGKPMFFFTPDLRHYRENLRGFYFDLIPVAPGPIVLTVDELVQLVRDRQEIAPVYADRYAAWRARFNPSDDGKAAERVVARLESEGFLGPVTL